MKKDETSLSEATLIKRIRKLEREIEDLRQRKPEEYLQNALDKSRDLIVVIQDGKVKYANPVLEEFSGYSFEMIRDKPFVKFLSGNVRQLLRKNYEARISGQRVPEHYETVIHNKKGEEVFVEISGHVITYQGKPADFVLLHNITPLKKMIEELRVSEVKYRNFFKASKDCVFFTTPDGIWLDMSDSAPVFFGYSSKEELAAIPIPELYVDPEDRKNDLEKIEKEGSTRDVPIKLKKKDGTTIHTLITSQAILDEHGRVIAYQGIIRDITELKKKEELLRESKKRLEETLAARDKFFSIISHDLRSPFNGIIGLSDFLRREAHQMPPDEIASLADDLYRTGQETYELLSNLLAWSRTVTGKITLTPETFTIADLSKEIETLYRENMNRKNIRFDSTVPHMLSVYADRNMIRTVLRNLFTNAIKYSHPGGIISIKAEEKDGFVTVSISDTGIGIPEEKLKTLFDHNHDQYLKGTFGESGSGLGLILCKEFTELNHGKIHAASTVGKGSTFYIQLPAPGYPPAGGR